MFRALELGIKCVLVMLFFIFSMILTTQYAIAETSYSATLGENSAYTLTESANNAPTNIYNYVYDSVTGELTKKYYTMSLKKTSYGTGSSTSTYSINSSFLNVSISANYDSSEQGRITNSGNNPSFNIEGIYVGNYENNGDDNYAYGAVIYNDNNSVMGDINADFIGNHTYGNYSKGGAIYNAASASIGVITGDFISNYTQVPGYTSWGGAIYNLGEIEGIVGNFIGNYCAPVKECRGGAIQNSGRIGYIHGDFISNGVYTFNIGGAIKNDGGGAYIGEIKGDFIGNYAYSNGQNGRGGAIKNDGTIGAIYGDFIGNYSIVYGSSSPYTRGGAISNNGSSSSIGILVGDFIGNYAQSVGNYVHGGAVASSNGGTIELIKNSSFYDNYVNTSSGSALGGAIYSAKSLHILADNGVSVFSGNYTQKGSNAKNYEAIYIGSSSETLKLEAKNNGIIQFDDYINGLIGYDVKITGDSTGVVNLYNDIKNADVITDTVTLNLANDTIKDYSVKSLTSNANTKYVVDVDITNAQADRIVTSSSSSGIVTIENINITSGDLQDIIDNNLKIQILNTQNDNIQLALSETLRATFNAYAHSVDVFTRKDTVEYMVSWNDELYNYVDYGEATGIGIVTINTTNDSIGKTIVSVGTKEKLDVLSELNALETNEDRQFNFDSASDVYTSTQDVGETSQGYISLNGVSSTETEKSTVNLNNNKGFELKNNSTLHLSNVKLTGNDTLVSVSNSNAVVDINNSYIDGDIIGSTKYELNIYGDNTSTMNGIVTNSDAVLKSGSLKFNTDTFADTNTKLTAQGGMVSLADGNTYEYVINELVSDAGVSYNIDINFDTKTSDVIKTNVASGGTVYIDDILFSGFALDSFKYQILNTQDNNLQLALSKDIVGKTYSFGDGIGTNVLIYDEIVPNVNWDDEFCIWEEAKFSSGYFILSTTTTTNDSLEFILVGYEYSKIKYGSMGDTLKLLNQFSTIEKRNFNFAASDNVYMLAENLGITTSGILNINGVFEESGNKRSVINADNKTMFILSNQTDLNIHDVEIKNAKNSSNGSAISITSSSAVVNLENVKFTGNYVYYSTSSSQNRRYGGAIYNNGGKITGISGEFNNNYVHIYQTADYVYTYAGAIGNYSSSSIIGDIEADFIGNYVYAQSTSGSADSHSYGGAIYNVGAIGNITGDFINNYTSSAPSSSSYSSSQGGAIYNTNKIGTITGTFSGNYSSAYKTYGGAIYTNTSMNETITFDCDANKIYYVEFAKILYLNVETMETIEAYQPIDTDALNEAISNGYKIYKNMQIYSEAVSNDQYQEMVNTLPDAIANGYVVLDNPLENIDSSNFVKITNADVSGSLISNSLFDSNYVNSYSGSAHGGALYVVSGSNNISSNLAIKQVDVMKAVITNTDTNETVTAYLVGDSINKEVLQYYDEIGGKYIINSINENSMEVSAEEFLNFKLEYDLGVSLGMIITEEDYNNYVLDNVIDSVNVAPLRIVNTNFIGNYAKSSGSDVKGGAIYTQDSISIVADNGISKFSGNYTQVGSGTKNYEAIYVSSSANKLTLSAINSGVIQFDDYINGSSGYNVDITGDNTGTVKMYNDIKNADVSVEKVTFDTANGTIKNYSVNSLSSNANAKYVIDVDVTNTTSDKFVTTQSSSGKVTISNINFINPTNTTTAFTVQVLQTQNDNLQLVLGENYNQTAENYLIGSTVISETYDEINATTKWNDTYNKEVVTTNVYGTISLAKTNTTNDSLSVTITDSTINQPTTESVGDILGFINGWDTSNDKVFEFDTSGDVYNASDSMGVSSDGVLNINGVASNNVTSTVNFNGNTGFELENQTAINTTNVTLTGATGTNGAVFNVTNENAQLNLTNTSLINNSSSELGGAIYSTTDVGITADGSNSIISGNVANGESNAVYIDNPEAELTLTAQNGGNILFNDTIDGQDGYSVNIDGDEESNVYINNKIYNANLTLGETNVNVTDEDNLNSLNSLTFNNTSISIANENAGVVHTPNLLLTGINTLALDVDLANETIDRITAENYTIIEDALLYINKLNIISPTKKETLSILFADSSFADRVIYVGSSRVAYSPIFRYKVSYVVDENDKQGYFTFVRGSTSSSSSFNPSVLASAIATQAGTYTAQLQTLNYAFQHSDIYMNNPTSVRLAQKHNNQIASTDNSIGVFSPLMTGMRSAGYWVKPYATFEDVPLKHGPKVSNINYGTLFGYDTPIETIKNGWDRVFTHYIGYNGSSMHFSGNSAYQNGGMIGSTLSLYKGKFFNATTIFAGANVGEASTMYGSENYTSFLTSIGNKTGYNFEYKEGKFIVQPSVLLSYSFINTFDYTNSAGVRIDSDPMSAIQIAPTLRFIGNTKNGWQPYFAVGMVWNIMAHTETTVGGVKTPNMYIKPYVQYGLGIQKQISERFMGFGQAMVYNGGRNGVMLSIGFRWAIGK